MKPSRPQISMSSRPARSNLSVSFANIQQPPRQHISNLTIKTATSSVSKTVIPPPINLHPNSPKSNQSLLNQSLLKSLEHSNSDAIDALYVNSVIANIRETNSTEHRGQLWESLHKSLLQVKSTKAALEAIAAAEHDPNLNVLKHETRELYIKLKAECKSFAGMDETNMNDDSALASKSITTAASSFTSLPNAKSLSSTTFVETNTNNNITQSRSIIDQALGNSTLKVKEVHKSTWTLKDRHFVSVEVVNTLRNLSCISQIRSSYLQEQQLVMFVRDFILLRIEPCSEFCLTSSNVSNLVVDLMLTHSNSLPLSVHETDSLLDWRESSILSSAIAKVLSQWKDQKNGKTKTRRKSRRHSRVKFCCSSITIHSQNPENEGGVSTFLEYSQAADNKANQLLHQLQSSIPTLSFKDSKRSFEEVKTLYVY